MFVIVRMRVRVSLSVWLFFIFIFINQPCGAPPRAVITGARASFFLGLLERAGVRVSRVSAGFPGRQILIPIP
jgi:hypothetical protein